jgi:hypothetical protein
MTSHLFHPLYLFIVPQLVCRTILSCYLLPLDKMPVAAASSASPASQPDVLAPFPSASTFAILPDIYLLIARLNILQQQQQPKSQTTSQPSQTQQSQTQSAGPSQAAAASSSSSQPPAHLQTGPALDIKDLPAQVYKIKQRLEKARAAVSALPDIQRSLEEQEREIQDLERHVGLLKGRLHKLGRIATATKQTEVDSVMEGVES